MKYDLIVFTKAPLDYAPVRISKEAKKMSLTACVISYPRVSFKITNKEVTAFWNEEALPEAKMVIFRAAGGDGYYIPQRDYLLNWYEKKGAKVLNIETYRKWPRLDKITQHFEFQKAGIPIIDSMNFGANQRLLSWAEDRGHYPFIAKHDLSSQGRDVYKVRNHWRMEKILENYRARTMLIQNFLTSGEDLRIIVIGGKIVGAMKRIARKGQYLTNYSRGGMVKNYDISSDPKAIEIVKKTVKHFSLEYVGVDLMKDNNGEWRVLEINRACQFEGFERSTKVNVARTIINFLSEKSSKNWRLF